MASPEQHQSSDFGQLTVEVSSFYDRLQYARSIGDVAAELEAETKMNENLDELSDVLRAIGHAAL